MQQVTHSTDGVVRRDRFAYWREEICEKTLVVTGERPTAAVFNARCVAEISDCHMRFQMNSNPFPHIRGVREIARRDWQDWVALARPYRGGMQWAHADSEIVAEAGDIVAADWSMPFRATFHRQADCDVWMFPRRLIEPHIPSGRLPASFHLQVSAGGVADLIKAYLDSFSGFIDNLTDDDRAAMVDNFCRLLAIAYGAQAPDHLGAVADAWLGRIKRHINIHLTDQSLSPARVAGANRLSVRQLHRLFEQSGLSFSRYVLARRLGGSRDSLTDRAHADRSVSEIAFGWGFNSLATFHRQFRAAYGMTPGDMRHSAQALAANEAALGAH